MAAHGGYDLFAHKRISTPTALETEGELGQSLARQRAAYDAAQRGDTAAQRQYRAGIEQSQLGMVQGAQARGLSPSQGRAAVYAGGQMQARASTESEILRAQELEAARQQYIAAQRGGVSISQQWQEVYQRALAAQEAKRAEEYAKAEAATEAGKVPAEKAAGMLMQGFFGGAMMSDTRAKQGITASAGSAEDRTIEGLRGYEYEYRPEAREMLGTSVAPPGERYGIMAQDLERTPLGRTMVDEGPAGAKMVDTKAASMASLALIGRLGERVAELEAQRGKRKPTARWAEEG